MKHLVTLALLGLVAVGPAWADSSAASSASESLATSVGSLSDSIKGSSNSSTDNKVAAGEYRVIEMADAGAGQVRLRLQPLAAGAEFALLLPAKTAQQHALAAGQLIDVRARDYGLEFAKREDRQTFYLVLADEWYRDLQTRPVTL